MKWVRWWGVAAFVIVTGIIAGGWLLFIDGAVECAIERAGTRLVGARVELDGADLTLSPVGLTLDGLRVTNPNEPMRNALDVRKISFGVDGSGLLRRKVIVEEMAVDGVRLNTERKTSGAVSGWRAKEPVKSKREPVRLPSFSLPDAGEIMKKEEIRSVKLIEELRADLEGEDKRWKERVDELLSEKKIEEYRKRFDALKEKGGGGAGGIGGLIGGASEAVSLKNDIEADVKRLKEAQREFESSLKEYRRRVEEAARAPGEEARRLLEKYSITPGGLSNMTALLLGEKVRRWTDSALMWQKRLAPVVERVGERKKGNAVVRPSRSKGVDVHFPEPGREPDFLIRKAAVSVELPVGDIGGTVRNITPDQDVLGSPLTYDFSGDRLKGLSSVKLSGVHNHIDRKRPVERADLMVRGLKVKDLSLSASDELPVRLDKGLLDLRVKGGMVSGVVDAAGTAGLTGLDLSTGGMKAEGRIAEVFSSAIEGIRELEIRAEVTGTLEDYEMKISSDLDRVLRSALEGEVRKQTRLLEERLTRAIGSEAEGPLKDLRGGMKDLGAIEGLFSGRIEEALGVVSSPAASPGKLPGGLKLPF